LMKLGQNMLSSNIKNPIDSGSFISKNDPLAAILNFQISHFWHVTALQTLFFTRF